MQSFSCNALTSLFLRFYARCFVYPYDEMGYELQHIFRQLERNQPQPVDHPYLEQVLNVINHFQGEEIKELRENYVALFTRWESGEIICPLLAGQFTRSLGIKYNPELFVDLLFDSDIPIDPEDQLDSVVNYLEYFSVICDNPTETPGQEDTIQTFYNNHIVCWIPYFCDLLFRSSNISFYKEVAIGLNEFLLQTGESD